jgi:AraC family transcriptional regulator
VVEILATPMVRKAIAAEMHVEEVADLDELHGGTDSVIWGIAVQVRSRLRAHAESDHLEYEQFIWELYRHVFATRFGGRLPEKGHDGKLDRRRLDRVVAFIDAHLTGDRPGVAALADVASLSPFHFLRSFHRTFHMTPHSYVRARRLEGARLALERGEALMAAARRHGFGHLRHFEAVYRRHHGVMPHEHHRQGTSAQAGAPDYGS